MIIFCRQKVLQQIATENLMIMGLNVISLCNHILQVIMIIHFLAGYVAIFACLIPILFLNIQNYITCTILTIPLGFSGTFLQLMSALTSMTRYYMSWMTSRNKIYQDKVVITAITLTGMGQYFDF